MPDNVSVATFSVTIAAGGACPVVKTTPLSIADALEAMKKAGRSGPQGGCRAQVDGRQR
jgi:hypothetical protein